MPKTVFIDRICCIPLKIFHWATTVAPTDIEFFSFSNLGERYTNNIFVGDITGGNLYHFEINENRDGIGLDTTQQQSD
jgi:hypothetical protein